MKTDLLHFIEDRKLMGVLILVLYVLTRIYIWVDRPEDFSQITAVYMPYAHLWQSGETPYLKQWYEYPPATIPLFYLPHIVDVETQNMPIHINYGNAYRGMILLVDVFLFWLIYSHLTRSKVRGRILAASLIFYSLSTAKAHDFIYDSMDLVFIAAVILGIVGSISFKSFAGVLIEWVGYFLGVGLKLINAPLGLVYLVLSRHSWRRSLVGIIAGGIIVWSVPLLYFRSSLSVMFVYHSMRGLQVESVPAQIASFINAFSGTERFVNEYQSMNIVGPVSSQIAALASPIFYLAIIVTTIWLTIRAYYAPIEQKNKMQIAVTIAFLYGFVLFAKVLSTPYHLWFIPLLALYPFSSNKRQLQFLVPAFIVVVISMTLLPNFMIGPLSFHLVIGITRSVLLGYLFILSLIHVNNVSVGRA